MKKWIIATIIGIVGFVLLVIGAKLNADLDAYHLSQPGPHGQWDGCGKGFLIWFFVIFLSGVSAVAAIILSILAGVKRWSRFLTKATYKNLTYWSFYIPVVTYIISFSSITMWFTVEDYLKYIK